MSEALENKAIELLDKMEKLATNYAPDVLDAAVEVVRISAVGNLIVGMWWLFAFALVVYTSFKFFKALKAAELEKDKAHAPRDVVSDESHDAPSFKARSKEERILMEHTRKKYDTLEENEIAAWWVTAICGVITGICVVVYLFNFWSWVALFNPELALARQVLGL